MSASIPHEVLRVMPREMRMMTERVLSQTALPKGFFMSLHDVVMYSQKLGLGGFAMLETRFDRLRAADPSRIAIVSESGPELTLDGGGQHAWMLVPSLNDLLAELVERHGRAEIRMLRVVDPAELQVAAALGARKGLAARFVAGDEPRFVAAASRTPAQAHHHDALLDELLRDGVLIGAALWWRIYHLAQQALAPESVVSRRHAGPLIVNDDGTVIGRRDNDDETDISFLATVKSAGAETEEASS